jgi:hypothetical protein
MMLRKDGGVLTMRVGRISTIGTLIGSVTFGIAMMISSWGCSGSDGGQATIDPEEQKVAQDKMKDYIKNRPPLTKGAAHQQQPTKAR